MRKKLPFEYKITITYIIIGALWILLSDHLVEIITSDIHKFQIISTYKGWFYVFVTGLLFFILIKKESHRRNIIQMELQTAKKKAIESDNLKTAFLSHLSHYIRTPTNCILGFTQLLEDKEISSQTQHQYLSYINENSLKLLETLSNIVEISKIQQGLIKTQYSKFKINTMINNIIIASENINLIKRKSITVKTTYLFNDEDDEIYSDRDKLMQILTCLFTNSINFTDKGEITIGYYIKKNNIIFFVRDTGNGISIEKQNLLFTNYMFNDSFTTTLGEGVGLGLYMSNELSKLIDGDLWLENTNPQGTTFCMSIPLIK